MKKPRVFLSHASQDKNLMERLARDLQRARLDVWYDDWEIPPGDSFRKKIFEEGIPNCDLLFAYISSNSADSYWVRRELDAGFIEDTDRNGGFVAVFVESDEIRARLPVDIRSLNSPVLNDTDAYYSALTNLISKAWEASLVQRIRLESQKYEFQLLKSRNEYVELENRILRIESTGVITNMEEVIVKLDSKYFIFNSKALTLKMILKRLGPLFAAGTNEYRFNISLDELYTLDIVLTSVIGSASKRYEVLGELLILGIVNRERATDNNDEVYALSDFGKVIVQSLRG
jgi:hypothetical protein